MNEIPSVEVLLSDPQGTNNIRVNALIDTGASVTVVPKSVVLELGLQAVGKVAIKVYGTNIAVNEYLCRITVSGFSLVQTVIGMQDIPVPLLGMDIIGNESLSHFFVPKIFIESINILHSIPTVKRTTVLILGQDTTEIERLHAIKKRLNYNGYTGIIAKEVSDIEIQSIEEKVNMLASLCRFIICENTVPSGHIDELKICAFNRFVTAIIQERGKGATWMQSDYSIDYSFMKTFHYSNLKEIDSIVDNASEWAEKKIKERRAAFNKLYKWRKD